MAKKKAANQESKSDFLRRMVRANPRMTYHEMNVRWKAEGHPGEITNTLYNRVRADVAIQLMEERAIRVLSPEAEERHRAATAVERPKFEPRPIVLYQFKITLLDVLPVVWRRIQVQDCDLRRFHELIQHAMGWADAHPHHFVIDGILYGCSIVLGTAFKEKRYWDTWRTDISKVLPKDGSRFKFEYEYDFDSSWRHEILFEGRPPAEKDGRYPQCVEGQGACPPENIGGPADYAEFLRVIADPAHPRHFELRQWVGRPFHPEVFDRAHATHEMRHRESNPYAHLRRGIEGRPSMPPRPW